MTVKEKLRLLFPNDRLPPMSSILADVILSQSDSWSDGISYEGNLVAVGDEEELKGV